MTAPSADAAPVPQAGDDDGAVAERAYPPAGGGELAGPWEQAFWFTVRGEVRSKSNHRRGDRRGGTSAWNLEKSYELQVRGDSRPHRPAGWDRGDRDAPVAARPKVVFFCFARSMLDAGNLDKSLHDALQGEVMVTDAQVCWTAAHGVRTSTDPGVVIAVAHLAPTATVAEQAEAGIALVRATMAQLAASPH